jgi:hypothetical protein
MQSLREQQNGDEAALDAAIVEVEKAYLVCRSRRDTLAQSLLPELVNGLIWGQQVEEFIHHTAAA